MFKPSRHLWLAHRRPGSLVRLRRSPVLRLVATLIAGLMVGGSAPQVWALPPRPQEPPLIPAALARPQAPAPAAPAPAPAPVLVPARLTPLKLERIDAAGAPLRTQAADDPWLAFDRDPATALVASDGQPVRMRITLRSPRRVTGLLMQGHGGKLSLLESATAGAPALDGLAELPLAPGREGWQQASGGAGSRETAQLVLVWHPAAAGDRLAETAVLGLAERAPAAGEPLADALYGATPPGAIVVSASPNQQSVSPPDRAASASAGRFTLQLARDPRSIGRAFLVYQLSGVSHWTGVPRSVNGHARRGGEGLDRPGDGGLQVEEIAPGWLRAGANEIRFEPKSDEDPLGYRVTGLRLVMLTAEALPQAMVVGGGRGADLSDGRDDTGVNPRRAGGLVDVAFARRSLPLAVSFQVAKPVSGSLIVRAVRNGKISRPMRAPIELGSRTPGWHHVPLDNPVAADGLRLSWEGQGESGGLLSELHVTAEPLAPPRPLPGLQVTHPLHGECVDGRAYVRGFVSRIATPAGVVRMEVDGRKLEPGPGLDGSFAFETAAPAGRKGPWKLRLSARFPDGGSEALTVPMGPCAPVRPVQDSAGRFVVEDVGAPYGQWVRKGQAARLSFGGATLDIPAGAVATDVRITMRPLLAQQVPALDPGMDNLTPGRQAFRLGPHGLRFKQPITIPLPYDPSTAAGRESGRFGTFYYDETEQKVASHPAPGSGQPGEDRRQRHRPLHRLRERDAAHARAPRAGAEHADLAEGREAG